MAAPAYILSLLVWLPIAAGVAVLLLGDRRIALGRWVALAATLGCACALRAALVRVRPVHARAAVRRA